MSFWNRGGPVIAGEGLHGGPALMELLAGIVTRPRRRICASRHGTRTGFYPIVWLATLHLGLGSPTQTQACVLFFSDFRIIFDEKLSVPENEAAVVTVDRDGNLEQSLDITFAKSGGTARPGIDYLPFDTLSFHFAPGEKRKQASITLIDNSMVDDLLMRRTIDLLYQGPAPSGVNAPFHTPTTVISTTIAITDNETAPSIDVNYRPENALGSSPFAVQSDGRIVLLGFEDLSYRSRELLNLIRLDHDGSRDPSFHGGFRLASDENIAAIYVQPDDRILLLREETDVFRGRSADLLRFDTNGSWLSDFSLPTKFSGLTGALPLSDGRTLIQGSFGIARLLQNGAEDSSFEPDAGLNQLANKPGIEASVELPGPNQGKVVLGFSSFRQAKASRQPVRLNRDGSLDPTFKPAVVYAGGSIRAQPDGKVVLFGIDVDSAARLFRLKLDGSLDRTFASPEPEGECFPAPIFDFRPGGGVVVTDYGCSGSNPLAKIKDNGSPDGYYTAGNVNILRAMHVEPNGDLLLSVPHGSLSGLPSVDGVFVHGSVRVLANPPRTQLLVAPANPDYTSDCPPQIELYTPAEEVSGVARLNLFRQGDSSTVARVRFSTVDDTALAVQDYSSVSGWVEFLPLETKKTITIPIFDRYGLADLTFFVQFSEPQGFESIQKSITVKIPKDFTQIPSATLNFLGGTKLRLANLYPKFAYHLETSTDLKHWQSENRQSEILINYETVELNLSELQITSESRLFFRVVGSPIDKRHGCN